MEAQKRIILVEDDAAIQDAVAMLLERAGYAVLRLNDGAKLLAGAFEAPHVFILDKQLSGTDGIAICRHLKMQDRTRHLPVIILSASPGTAALARDACADAFLEKPFKMQALRDLVAGLLV